jgi:class 3 adenylate cyclase
VAEREEVRKTVTVLFADVVSSTALGEQLDPEALRRVMSRYFEAARAAVERHGGTVEKFIGDAVMAVFGIPTLHEDDALRAVRAAAELRGSLGALNEQLERESGVTLELRIGLNTGEVVAGRGESLVTGDAVNVAKRFEEAAGAGEILVGDPTYRLVRDAVEAEPVEPLALKGKAEAVAAFRVLSVREGVPGRIRRLDSPMVGRQREQRLLQQAYERAVGERACHLFTVLGAAGVGKSRLVAELLEDLGESAMIARGRCLSYGEGITFWPLLEVLRPIYGENIVSGIAARLAGDESAETIAGLVGSAVGLAESTGPNEEIFWAVRRLFEAHARERPLVVVFDDVQWAEPTFLDLVEHVADLSRDAPVLLICLARPELLDTRPAWGGGKFNATSVLLEPLDDEDSEQLIANLLGRAELDDDVRARVTVAAEGNPLFVEEMLGMLIDDGLLLRRNGSWVAAGNLDSLAIPPSIQALLSARLDRLGQDERAVVERASVEGKVFHHGAVAALTPEAQRDDVSRHLQMLVRKELLRPDRSSFAGDDAYRFRHLLIRDAAYEAMPKELRADLHRGFARWLEQAAAGSVSEYEEILGYHLEQAYGYRVELATVDDETRSLGAEAADRLGSAGERAHARGDAPAASSLLERALEVLSAESPGRAKLLSDLGLALSDQGEFARADSVLSDARRVAEARQQPVAAAIAAMRSAWVENLAGGAGVQDTYSRVDALTRMLEESGDEAGIVEAYHLLGVLLTWKGQNLQGEETCMRAASLARRIGNNRLASRSLSWVLIVSFWGPRPVTDALTVCERAVRDSGGSRYVEGYASVVEGALHALAGRWDEARARTVEGRALLEELGQRVSVTATRMPLAEAQYLAGQSHEAERELRFAYEVLNAMGEKAYLSTVTALLALVLCGLERYNEAEPLIAEAHELGARDDLSTQLYARSAEAEVLASRGAIDQGRLLIQDAQSLIDPTDYLIDRGAALLSRARVEEAAGSPDQARASLEQAIELFAQKGATSAVAYTRSLIAEL